MLLIRFTICSLCILTYCNLSYFPLWFGGGDFDSDCISSWPLFTFYFQFKCQNIAVNQYILLYRVFWLSLTFSTSVLFYTTSVWKTWLEERGKSQKLGMPGNIKLRYYGSHWLQLTFTCSISALRLSKIGIL